MFLAFKFLTKFNFVLYYKKYLKFFYKRNFKKSFFKHSGRNNQGKITVFSKTGGVKRLFINYDNFRKMSFSGIVLDILKTSYRNSYLGLIFTTNGFFCLIILPNNINIGDNLEGFSKEGFSTLGSSSFIKNCFLGMWVYNIEIKPGQGIQLVKSAGTGAFIYSITKKFTFIKLNSGWLYRISNSCIAVKGFVNNNLYNKQDLKFAGVSKKLGWKPKVRGVAMNPVDHPHGGGEGKKSPRNAHRSPWGKLTKNVKTRKLTIKYWGKSKVGNLR